MPNGPPKDIKWPDEEAEPASAFSDLPRLDFWSMFHSRRSTRELGPASIGLLKRAVEEACWPAFELPADPMHRLRGPAVSAGALHGVTPVLVTTEVRRFDHRRRCWFRLRVSGDGMSAFVGRAGEVLPSAHGAWIVLIASDLRYRSAYTSPGSLMLRDSGALLQALALSAHALGLGYCPLGILGTELRDCIFGSRSSASAVGSAAIGSLPS